MIAFTQKRVAVAAALIALGLLAAANAHLVAAALQSEPPCVAVEGAGAPAKRVC